MKFTISALFVSLLSAATAQQTIVDIASGNADFSTLVSLVSAAGLVDALNGNGPLTVFAPTNEAFGNLPAAVVSCVAGTPDLLTGVLTYHVVGEGIPEITASTEFTALNEDVLNVTVTGTDVSIGDVGVTTPAIAASNGFIYVLDNVLVPPSLASAIMDCASNTVVDIAAGNDAFSTLVDLVTAANLVDTLSGPGPFTVFAPTNDAFGKLPEAVVTCVTDPANSEWLAAILTHHVAPAAYPSLDESQTIDTVLEGSPLEVAVSDSGVMIGTTTVTTPPVVAGANGFVYIIDEVLVPAAIAGDIMACAGMDGTMAPGDAATMPAGEDTATTTEAPGTTEETQTGNAAPEGESSGANYLGLASAAFFAIAPMLL